MIVRIPLSALVLLAPQEEEFLHIEQAPPDFWRRWEEAERAQDGHGLLELYLLAREKWGRRLAPAGGGRWVPLPRQLQIRMTRFPAAILGPHETLARDRLRSRTDRLDRLKEAEVFLHTTAGQQALAVLASEMFDEGRLEEAVHLWMLLLQVRSDPPLMARAAHALALLGERPLFAPADPSAPLLAGGRPTEIGTFLESLAGPDRQESAPPHPGPPPHRPDLPAEVLLGIYDLRLDGGAFAPSQAVSLPALADLDGESLVAFTNGVRITVLDPWLGEGDSLEEAVRWRFPLTEEPLREIPTAYESPRHPQPLLGAVVSDGRVFATMFSRVRRARLHGRRPDRFDGPAAIRAFDLRTGRLLWDTDELWTDVEGEPLSLLEALGLHHKNFCFAGPPRVRGSRLFAAVMTSPNTERECHILCLNAADGRLLWSTSVASAYRPGWPASIPTFTEENGRLYLQTNFGAVAALEAESGAVEWLLRYESQGSRSSLSPPICVKGRVLFLLQDRTDPLCLDHRTGREAPLPPLSTPVAWWRTLFLAPGPEGWFAAIGRPSLAVHSGTGTVLELTGAETDRPWRPFVDGNRLHIPLEKGLILYDMKRWEKIAFLPWPAEGLGGHFVAGGGLGVTLSNRLAVTAGTGALRERFRPATEIPPPRADVCLRASRILQRSGRFPEAESYRRRALLDPDPR